MSQESVEKFLGRAITDDRFRERARKSLEKCCLCEGYAISQAEQASLEKLDFGLLNSLAAQLDAAIRRY